jgi:hypothetical protein
MYRSALSLSVQDGRLRDRTRNPSANVGGAVPDHGEKSNRNAVGSGVDADWGV